MLWLCSALSARHKSEFSNFCRNGRMDRTGCQHTGYRRLILRFITLIIDLWVQHDACVSEYKGTSNWNFVPTLNFTRSSAIAEGPRDASCQLKSCQLPRNSTETTCTTSPEQIKVMKLEGYSGPMCNKHQGLF